jgi:predicted metalloprotease
MIFDSRSRVAPAALLAAAALAAGGCQQTEQGQAQVVDVTKVAGMEVTDFDSGLRDGAPNPRVEVDNGDGGEIDTLVMSAVEDPVAYWGEVFPEKFDMEYPPVRRLASYDASQDSPSHINICGASTAQIGPNALYCPLDDTVAWDRGLMLPTISRAYGEIATVAVMAHEWGHAVQHRLGEKAGIGEHTKTIVKELQADCFTGSYLRWVAEGNSEHFELSTGPGVNAALGALYHVRDPDGTMQSEPGAHGTAFDRIQAFHEGFERGPKECADYTDELLRERTTQQKFSEQDTGKGNVRIDAEHLGLVEESLEHAFDGVEPPEIVTGSGGCEGGPDTSPASYCPGADTIAVDLDELAVIGEPRGDKNQEFLTGERTGGKGDFAAWASVASRYALAVQQSQGDALDDELAPLRTACLVGS